VTNWTLSDRRRRVDLDVRIPYGSDAERVLVLLLEVAGRDPRVMRAPEPESLFMGFGEKDLQFQLRAWTEDPHWVRLRSDLGVTIQEAMREARIGAAAGRPDR
jgi:small-conductance mechanosensitive channel